MLIFCFFCLFIIEGCTIPTENTETITLDAPINIREDMNLLRWNPVDYAVKYQVKIDDNIEESEFSHYDLSHILEAKSYEISIRAIGDGKSYMNSVWSSVYTYNKTTSNNTLIPLETTSILGLSNNFLSWTPVENAVSYEIDIIDSVMTSIPTSLNISALFNSDRANCYARVRAIPALDSIHSSSPWSELYIFNYDYETGNANSSTMEDPSIKVEFKQSDRYIPQQVEGDLQFDYSITYEDDYDYYYFYIGNLLSTPIFTSNAKRYDYDGEYTVKVGKATEEMISNTTSKAIETIDTHSYTGGFNVSLEFESGLALPFAKIQGAYTVSTDHKWTNNSGQNITRTEENVKSYSTVLSEEYEIKYVFSESSGFTKGRSYRETLFETVDVFAVIAYDRGLQVYTYELIPFIRGNNNRTFVTEESDEFGSFNRPSVDDRLEFNINSAIDYIQTIESTDKTVYSDETDYAHTLGFDGGSGTPVSPFIIGGAWKPANEQFLLIQNQLSSHYILNTDVDLSGYIAPNYKSVIVGQFTGSLNGYGHSISGLKMDLNYQNIRPSEGEGYKYRISLFEHLGTSSDSVNNSSIIENLILDNFDTYFSPYHEKSSEIYSFGLLVSTGNGIIKNVTIKNSKLETLRAQAKSGIIAGVFKGEIIDSMVTDSFIKTNGDGGGIVGTNYGLIQNCQVIRTTISFYFQKYDNVAYETSIGGIAGTNRNTELGIGTIENASVIDSIFIIRNLGNFGFLSLSHYNPKIGYIVGYALDGRIYQVGMTNCTNELTNGVKGDYYFAVGWGYAGKISNTVDVK